MVDEKNAPEENEEVKAPVSEICGNAEELAASLVEMTARSSPSKASF